MRVRGARSWIPTSQSVCVSASGHTAGPSIALFLGLSFAAQLEAARALRPGPITADPGA